MTRFLLFCIFFFSNLSYGQQRPDFYQENYLAALLKNDLEEIVLNIQEEKLEAVYNRGDKRSKLLISRENFIDRMIKKNVGIAFSNAIIEIKSIKFFSLTTANIIARIRFVNRTNTEQTFEKNISFFVYFEKDINQVYSWNFNLLKLVRIPF